MGYHIEPSIQINEYDCFNRVVCLQMHVHAYALLLEFWLQICNKPLKNPSLCFCITDFISFSHSNTISTSSSTFTHLTTLQRIFILIDFLIFRTLYPQFICHYQLQLSRPDFTNFLKSLILNFQSNNPCTFLVNAQTPLTPPLIGNHLLWIIYVEWYCYLFVYQVTPEVEVDLYSRYTKMAL